MKVVIICALAIVALVQIRSVAGTVAQINRQHEFPAKQPLRIERSDQVCEPGSTKQIDCNSCFCAPNGAQWGCTQIGCEYSQIELTASPDIPN